MRTVSTSTLTGFPLITSADYIDAANKKRHCKGYVALSETVKAFPAYNWKAFGFEIFEEQGEKDRYVFDYDQSSPYIQKIIDQIDTDKNKEISEPEIDRALKNKTVISELSHYICWHRNEWSYDEIFDKLQPEIEALFDKKIKEEKDGGAKEKLERQKAGSIARTKERIKRLCFWKDIKIDTTPDENGFALKAFPASPYVYHFNPIAFVEQIIKCGKAHIDLRAAGKWVSQADSWPGKKEPSGTACCETCKYILVNKYGLGTTSGNPTNMFQVAREIADASDKKDQSVYISVNTEIARKGVLYLDEQLEKGHPVLVGVDHTYGRKIKGKTINEGTTDHFIVIVGRGSTNGETYYLFYEVGIRQEILGISDDNKLYLKSDHSLRGKTAMDSKKNYVVTQIRRNQ